MKTLLTLLLCALPVYGQFNPYSQRTTPPNDPRERRALREGAVSLFGDDVRPLVESDCGDEFALVLRKVSRNFALRLIAAHTTGDIQKIARLKEILLVIAQPQYGDEVCLFVVNHAANELTDRECCDAFLETSDSPLNFALELKKLSVAGAELRAKRLSAPQSEPWKMPKPLLEKLMGIACIIAFIALLVWLRRRRHASDGPA